MSKPNVGIPLKKSFVTPLLHPDWNHDKPAAYAVFIPDKVRTRFDDYAVFVDYSDASLFTDELAQEIADQLGREATAKEMTIYPLHAVTTAPAYRTPPEGKL